MDYSTTEFVVPPYIAQEVQALIEGRKRVLSFSRSVHANLRQTCIWCGQDGLFPCSNGADLYYLAEVTADADGQRWAEVTRPHLCAEGQRHEDFMNSPEEDF